jgi:hypothetical protein
MSALRERAAIATIIMPTNNFFIAFILFGPVEGLC